jgi:hypothetical protein
MKKILFVCDGENFPEGAFKFITRLQLVETISLKALFFTEVAIDTLNFITAVPVGGAVERMQKALKQEVHGSRDRFIEKCESAGIRYKIGEIESSWDKERFVNETRFADLVVISKQLFYQNISDFQPNVFMREALHVSECPVMIIPESFVSIDRIVLAYDGKKESAFALKQFTQMFSQFEEFPIEFVYVKSEEKTEIPDKELLKEYSNAHFDAGNIREINILEHHSFSNWLNSLKNVLIISGSYSRSAASRMVKPSFISQVIQKNSVPLFIAHNA